MRAELLGAWVAATVMGTACGGRQVALCGGVECGPNTFCASSDEGERCACRDGYVDRSGRCQPEGPCGRLASDTCAAVGGDETACETLRRAVVLADGPACERRLGGGVGRADVDWLGEVLPMLERRPPAEYAAMLTRSLLDPCGAASDLLCRVLRSGDRSCPAGDADAPGDDRACRSVLRNYDRSIASTGAGSASDGAGEDEDAISLPGVFVRLVPDPASTGTLSATVFRTGLYAVREEIEACWRGAAQAYPGLSGRAVFQVSIALDGAVAADLGRGDGPIVGSGVAECVRDALGRIDLAASPPAGGEFSVHVVFDFGVR